MAENYTTTTTTTTNNNNSRPTNFYPRINSQANDESLVRFSVATTTTTTTRSHPTPPPSLTATSRVFALGSMRFRVSQYARLWEAIMDGCAWFMESLVYVMGPVLICLALGITSMLTYAFFTIILPMMWEKHDASHSTMGWLIIVSHVSFVIFIVENVLFNYALCVATRHKGPNYDQVVRELAAATQFVFPETPEQVAMYKREYEDRMVLRMRRRQTRYQQAMQQQQQQEEASQQQKPKQIPKDPLACSSQTQQLQSTEENSSNNNNGVTQRRAAASSSSTTTTTTYDSSTAAESAPAPPAPTPPFPIRRWMLMGPFEWGYCGNSKQPKPPRSHFDHVSKTLVLNLDHYCPWMFNASKFYP